MNPFAPPLLLESIFEVKPGRLFSFCCCCCRWRVAPTVATHIVLTQADYNALKIGKKCDYLLHDGDHLKG